MMAGGRPVGQAQRLLLAAAMASVIGLMWLLERVGVPESLLTPVLLSLPLMLFLLVGLGARTMSLATFDAADRSLPAAVATLALPVVVLALLVLAGNAPALRWGAVAGLVLHAVLAPFLHDVAAPTPAGTLAGRFGAPARCAVVVVLMPVTFIALTLMLQDAAVVLAQSLAVGYPAALRLLFVLAAVVAMVGGLRAVAATLAVQGGLVAGFAGLLAAALAAAWWHTFAASLRSGMDTVMPFTRAGAPLLTWLAAGPGEEIVLAPFLVAMLGVAALPIVTCLSGALPGRGLAGRVSLRAAVVLAAVVLVADAAAVYLPGALLEGSWLLRQMSAVAHLSTMLAGVAALGFLLGLILSRDVYRVSAPRASTARKTVIARLAVLAALGGAAAAGPLAGSIAPAVAVNLILGVSAGTLLPALLFALLPGGRGWAVAIAILGGAAIVASTELPALAPALIAGTPALAWPAAWLGSAAPLWAAAWTVAVMALGLALSRWRGGTAGQALASS
ncbi:hypothetical protein BOQ54_15900 [Chelatococcus daeguensis]|uniref:Uncharacterized protein n=2 Tax=Chelatococcus daeguensis TaxID=444444 RepID=A0AAC9JTZ9_9HYPH|nr:hypothetical protein BOQ54_15900 [Chelatococcus daeguensis]